MTELLTLTAATVTNVDPGNLPHISADSSNLKTLLDIAFGILGALSLLMITISGFRYVLSAGDPQKTASAREGIVYALVGLIIAITAGSIITFVVGNL
jgi:hypothetical protein